jgi:hypothetical protein
MDEEDLAIPKSKSSKKVDPEPANNVESFNDKKIDLNSKDIEYEITLESNTRFTVNLKYKDQYYKLKILPFFSLKRPNLTFGSTDENYENMNFSQLLNSPHSPRILAAVFGLIRYWVDKYNIQQFEYG